MIACHVVLGLMLLEGLVCACFAEAVKETLQRLPEGTLRLAGAVEAAAALLIWVLAVA